MQYLGGGGGVIYVQYVGGGGGVIYVQYVGGGGGVSYFRIHDLVGLCVHRAIDNPA